MSALKARLPRYLAVAALLVAVGSQSGCAMVNSLKPVAGDEATGLKIAASDVLLEQNLQIAVVPVCILENPETYTCKGETMANEPIAVSAPNEDEMVMTISVAGKEVFKGKVTDVLQRNGQVK